MRTFLLLFFMIIAEKAVTQQPYMISYYYSNNRIDLKIINNLSFQEVSGDTGVNKTGKGYYLFKITLGKSLSKESALLLIENEHLDTATLYRRSADTLILVARAGNSFPETTSQYGLPQFRLNTGSSEYYMLTKLADRISFKTKIAPSAEMNQWSTKIFFQLGVYYGISLMFFLMNVFLFVYLKERLFLHYCLFQIFVILSIAYADGLFPFILSNRWLLNHADVPLHMGMAAAGTLFATTFLGSPVGALNRVAKGGLLALMVIAYLCYLFFENQAFYIAGESLMLAPLFNLWISATGQFSKHRHARFFVIGYGIFLAFALDYFVLRRLSIDVLDLYMGQLKTGSIVEMLVLYLAIMLRIQSLQRENIIFRNSIEENMRLIAAYETREHTQTQHLFDKIKTKHGLTDREIAVLRGINEGLTNQQIADRVFLSVHTVKFHTRNIFDKLDITNRTQALAKLRE